MAFNPLTLSMEQYCANVVIMCLILNEINRTLIPLFDNYVSIRDIYSSIMHSSLCLIFSIVYLSAVVSGVR